MPFLQLNHRIEYEWLGPGPETTPTIIMLHHGLGSLSAWREFPQAVADRTGLGVCVYSRWGCGRSEPVKSFPHPVEFMHLEAKHDLHGLLNVLKVRKPILLGHSDGASIAILYAAAGLEPAPVSLILMAPHVFVEKCTIASAKRARMAYINGELREKLARHHEDPDSAFHSWNATWLMPQFRYWNIEAELPKVRCAVTVIQGLDDEFGTIRQISALEGGLEQAVEIVLLPECGHLLHRQREEKTLEAIRKHVRREL